MLRNIGISPATASALPGTVLVQDRSLSALNIVIAGGDLCAHKVLARILYEFGVNRVLSVADGSSVVGLLQRSPSVPHAIMTEWRLDDMDAMELIAGVRAQHPQLPFVILGSASEGTVLRCRRTPTVAYIRKPFTRDELHRKTKWIALRQARFDRAEGLAA